MLLDNLASLYRDEKKYADAEPLFKRALSILEKSAGDPDTAMCLKNYATMLRQANRPKEAEQMEARLKSMLK
jgi:tetratricopeptide (TPR) repeat protein